MLVHNPYFIAIAAIGVSIALIVLLLWLEAQRAQRRLDWEFHRTCITCGYDLRYSRRRCPECGTRMHTIPRDEMEKSTRAMTAQLHERRRHPASRSPPDSQTL